MKVKTLIATTLASFLVSSLGFAAPIQLADDMDNAGNATMQGSTDNTNMNNNTDQNNVGAMSQSSEGGNDDMTPDTTTGDDDY